MIEAVQLFAVVVAMVMLVTAMIDMGMNGVRYFSGVPILVTGIAVLVWLFAESAK